MEVEAITSHVFTEIMMLIRMTAAAAAAAAVTVEDATINILHQSTLEIHILLLRHDTENIWQYRKKIRFALQVAN